jgi:sugar/nucleoside kinase (ribokinase family)
MVRSPLLDRPFDVVTIGDCCVDLILSGEDVTPVFGQVEKVVGDYTLEVGGSTCLFAAQAAKLGLRTALLGVVGQDVYGRFIRERLAAHGVDVGFVRAVPGIKTGLGVALDRRGDRAILTYPGSIDAVAERDVPDAFLASARHLHLGSFYLMRSLRLGIPRLVERARSLGLTVSLDPNWDPDQRWDGGLLNLLPHIDYCLPNRNELLAIAGAAGAAGQAAGRAGGIAPAAGAADQADERGALTRLGNVARYVAVKRGAAGAWLWRGGGVGLECRPEPVPASAMVDSVGAGDAFDAGLIYGALRGWSDADALRAACACGRATVQARGGLAGQLDAARLRSLLDGVGRTWPTTPLCQA